MKKCRWAPIILHSKLNEIKVECNWYYTVYNVLVVGDILIGVNSNFIAEKVRSKGGMWFVGPTCTCSIHVLTVENKIVLIGLSTCICL